MNEPLFVGVDASTTACKAIVFDASGVTRSEGRAPIALHNPGPGAWEQDARDYLAAIEGALRGAVQGLPPEARRAVSAIAIACQRETFVVTDRDGAPLAPAIVWMDTRAAIEVEETCALMPADRIHDLSGKVPCTTPSLYKLRMLLGRLRPELAPVPKHVFDVHGFLVHHLTGQRVTSHGAADPMGLVDMRRGAFDDALVGLSRAHPSDLATLVPSTTVVGPLRDDVLARTGLPAHAVVVAGTGDGQAAALGAGLHGPGGAYLNVGTAVVMGTPIPHYATSRAFRTLFAPLPGGYFAESDLKGGTFTLDWLSDRLLGEATVLVGGEERAARLSKLERRAEALPPGSDGLYCLPYFQGVMNPYWNDRARGAFVGLTGDHGAHHLYRAIVEGLAFEQRLALEGIEAVVGPIDTLVGMGGALGRPLVQDVVASALGRALTLARTAEATALGAAMLAAIGAGMAVEEALSGMAAAGDRARIVPGASAGRYAELFEGFRRLYPALADAAG